MPKRRRLATGIYEDAYGRAVVYTVNGQRVETRFEIDRPVDFLVRWRARQQGQARELAPRDPRGSLARDIVTYLKRLKGTVGYKAEKSHLKSWVKHFGRTKRRWQITLADVELAIAAWRDKDVAPRTIRHRCRALQAVYRRLDGRSVLTPLDNAKLPPKPKPRPVSVADSLIATVAENLKAQEQPKVSRLRDSKTRARFLVLATTGRRPAEVKRARREDIDLHRRIWFTRTAKGGINTAVMLNDEMLAAWQLFIAAGAWGGYDDRSFSKTLKANGWPAHIRPYNLRHTVAVAIRTSGGDLEDVQDQLGHASLTTTREYYLHVVPARQAKVSQALAGRFTAALFAETPKREEKRRKARQAS